MEKPGEEKQGRGSGHCGRTHRSLWLWISGGRQLSVYMIFNFFNSDWQLACRHKESNIHRFIQGWVFVRWLEVREKLRWTVGYKLDRGKCREGGNGRKERLDTHQCPSRGDGRSRWGDWVSILEKRDCGQREIDQLAVLFIYSIFSKIYLCIYLLGWVRS